MKNKFFSFDRYKAAIIKLHNQKLIIALLASFIPYSSLASINFDVVRDSNNNFVRDSRGNCVRTSFPTSTDYCEVKNVSYPTTTTRAKVYRAYFDFDKSNLKFSEQQKLSEIANDLRNHNVESIRIIGFADKIGSDTYNLNLSKKRAESVEVYLDKLVEIHGKGLEVKGLGKTHQIKPCDEVKSKKQLVECLYPNRRVEVEVIYEEK